MPLPTRSNKRTDEIRRRRMMQSHATQSSTRKSGGSLLGKVTGQTEPRRRAAVTRTPPPVMAREVSGRTTRPQGRGAKNGRRVHRLALGTTGAEMRLPSAPRISFSWRFASVVLLAVLGAALYFLWTSPEFQVQAAEINGLQRLTRGDVNRELALRNQPVFTLDSDLLEEKLLASFPEFSEAEVAIDLPNTVVITVTERVPVLIWNQDGRTILVDGDGKTFQARDQVALGSLPVVESAGDPPPMPGGTNSLEEEELSPEEIAAKEYTEDVIQEFKPTTLFAPGTVEAILQLSTQLPQGAVMIYEPSHGFGWQDGRGWPVFFGDLSNLDIKLNAYRAIIEKLKTTGGMPELISVEFIHAPYYRLQEQASE